LIIQLLLCPDMTITRALLHTPENMILQFKNC
jgi:hypothetical protein